MEKGISIYLVILISTLILAISLGISLIFISQLKMTREIGDSVVAFSTADVGIEAVLYNPDNYTTGTIYYGYLDLNEDGNTAPPGTNCTTSLQTYPDDSCYAVIRKAPGSSGCTTTVPNYCIDSLGYFKKTRRAIQLSR